MVRQLGAVEYVRLDLFDYVRSQWTLSLSPFTTIDLALKHIVGYALISKRWSLFLAKCAIFSEQ